MVPSQVEWLGPVGIAVFLGVAALLWLAFRLNPTPAFDGEDPPPLWTTWCASEGSGSNGEAEDDPERPRLRPLVIEDITRRRWKIIGWLSGLGVPDRDTEDVAQEVIKGAWNSAPNYDPDRGKIETWLYRIAFHHAAAYHKTAYARQAVVCDPDQGPWQELPDPDNPEDLVAELEDIEHAKEIIARLPPHLATALVTVDFRGMDAKAYSRTRGKSHSTIISWLKQARKALALEVRREELLGRVKKRRP
jgi:RNA polymerase sigma-70 factor, ECF subfamily